MTCVTIVNYTPRSKDWTSTPFPDPMPSADDAHYLSFQDVFGKETTEVHRPSYTNGANTKKRKNQVCTFSVFII